jgi:PLP dependent protein
MHDSVAQLGSVQVEIQRACRDVQEHCGLANPPQVTLITVSKLFDAAHITPVLEANSLLGGAHRVFGENYVQEAAQKWLPLKESYPDVSLHMIGPLQSNKVKAACGVFDVIHTLDRRSLAEALAKEGQKKGVLPRLLIQVNTGEEPQKAGVLPHELEAFFTYCTLTLDLPVTGLMCIPPENQPPSPHFAFLRKLAATYALPELSMGMSADFEQAIMLGATFVRVGSRIFGARS